MAYALLEEAAKNSRLVMDTDSIHSVLSLLTLGSWDQEAWNILQWSLNSSFGEFVRPDSTIYSRVVSCACVTHNSGLLIQTFKSLANDSSLNIEESLFLDTLKYCSLTGYYRVALQVLAAYSKFHKTIPAQAYALFVTVRRIHI